MSTPPTSTPWVPLYPPKTVPNVVPTPVDGKWAAASGGAMVWADPYLGTFTPDSEWKEVQTGQFANGWQNYGVPFGPARYRRLLDGLVVLEGLIQGGTAGNHAFYLPPGYRLQYAPRHFFTARSANPTSWGILWVYPSGIVVPEAIGWTALDGVKFYSEVSDTWIPTNTSGCKVWLDASKLSYADGASIASWPNLAGGATTAYVGSGLPVIRTIAQGKVASLLGRRGEYEHHTHGHRPELLDLLLRPHVGGCQEPRRLRLRGHGCSGGLLEHLPGRASISTAPGQRTVPTPPLPTPPGGSTSVWGTTANAAIYKNGNHVTSLANPPGGWGTGFWLNGYSGTQERSDCDVAEFIAYDRQVSEEERNQIEYYLMKKWGGAL